ncbi:MAG: hypothetical protein C3F02_03820 [Parcubacteria group bacterium]|nr:MAG: hypothetical protein C3F02_03820 [Parcubacteria group bacterium]
MISRKKIILLTFIGLILVSGLIWFLTFKKIIKPFIPGLPGIDSGTVSTATNVLNYIDGLTIADKKILEVAETYVIFLKMQKTCESYQDVLRQKECFGNLELNQVTTVKKVDLCQYIQKKDDCYRYFASIDKDRQICDKIGAQEQRESCQLSVDLTQVEFSGQSLDECRSLTEAEIRNKCIFAFIGQQDDIKVCEDPLIVAVGSDGQTRCQDSIWYRQAIVDKDKSICEKIVAPAIRNNCQIFFAPQA